MRDNNCPCCYVKNYRTVVNMKKSVSVIKLFEKAIQFLT